LWLSIVREAGYCHLPKTQLSRQAGFQFQRGGEEREGDGRGEKRREEKRRESANGSQSELALTSAPLKDGCYVNKVNFFIVF
jgi:hypothetical protein